jgi:hypothetical protein
MSANTPDPNDRGLFKGRLGFRKPAVQQKLWRKKDEISSFT